MEELDWPCGLQLWGGRRVCTSAGHGLGVFWRVLVCQMVGGTLVLVGATVVGVRLGMGRFGVAAGSCLLEGRFTGYACLRQEV